VSSPAEELKREAAERAVADEVRSGMAVGLGSGSLADQLNLISREFYLTNVLQEIPEISSMAQLAEFTTEISDLQQAVPAFL